MLGAKFFGVELWRKIYPPLRRLNKLRNVVKSKISEIRSKKSDGDDLLTRMIISRYESGESIDNEQIVNEAMTFFAAGHETTSTALMYLTYLLVKNPQVQEKLRNEIISVVGDRDPTHEDLSKLKYLKNVVKEMLRHFMPLPLMYRYTKDDIIFESSGYKIPKGTALGLNVIGLHYDPSIWHDPTEFIPERYEEQKTDEEDTRTTAYQYIPFSAGSRNCIGQRFALQEIEITLAMLLRKIRFTEVVPSTIQNVYSGTMHPKKLFAKVEKL
jgi:cytochrome P450